MTNLTDIMKTCSFYLSFFLVLAVSACGSQETSKSESEEMADPTASTELVEKPVVLVDPDPSDDIPADQYQKASVSIETAEIVRSALQKKFTDDIEKGFLEENDRKFVQFEYDLNADGTNEILVGLSGPYFCGSGGCTQFILDKAGNVITIFSVSGYPVIIDANKSNGWNDLLIYSGGKNRIVKFDGTTYPSNPSTLPALAGTPDDKLPRALDFIDDKYPWFKF